MLFLGIEEIEEVEAGAVLEFVDAVEEVIERLAGRLVGDDGGVHRSFAVLDQQDRLEEMRGDGDAAGADYADYAFEHRAAEDIDGVRGGGDVADGVFEPCLRAGVHALELRDGIG